MKTTDLTVRVAKFRARAKTAKGGVSAAHAEARHAALAAAVGARMRDQVRPAGHGPSTTAQLHATRAVAFRKRFARTHGG